MKLSTSFVTVAILTMSAAANAATVRFDTDPFAGSDALTQPGRQVVGGEPSIAFNIATDVFALNPTVFDISSEISFANDEIGNLPTTNLNFIVLRSFDSDGDPATPFGAGTAANLIANQLTTPGAGFFIYFNQGLDLARLVYSTDLNDSTSDLKIIARLTNVAGAEGRDAMGQFTASNFEVSQVPEPSSALLMLAAPALWGCIFGLRKRRSSSN